MFTLLIPPPSHSVKSWGMKWFCHCQQIDNWVCFDFLGCPFPTPMLLDWHLQKRSGTFESDPTFLKEKNVMKRLLSPSQCSLVCTHQAIYLGRRQHALAFLPDYLPLWYSYPPVGLKKKKDNSALNICTECLSCLLLPARISLKVVEGRGCPAVQVPDAWYCKNIK